jgi:hypothetical protein
MVTDRLNWPGNVTDGRLDSLFLVIKPPPPKRNDSELRGLCNTNNVSIAGVLYKMNEERLMRSGLTLELSNPNSG